MLSRLTRTSAARYLTSSGLGRSVTGISTKNGSLRIIKLYSTPSSSSSSSSSTSTSSPDASERIVSVDRELPDPFAFRKQNYYYFTCYGLGVFLACVFIFNYEKTSSPVITSAMYFLRRSNLAVNALGDDITFAYQWPWIWGTLNTVKGDVDIEFDVKGSKNSAVLYLQANRESKQEQFKIRKWILKTADGNIVDLLKDSSIQLL